jgi:AcrR family transcriptional regulator
MATPQETATRDRILQAARALFAERGFAQTTIRDICRDAEANAAAVGYYFGGKEELYAAVLQDYLDDMLRRHPRDAGVTPESPAGERLRAYVRSHLMQTAAGSGLGDERLGRLVMQELVEPSPAVAAMFERHIRQTRRLLLDIVERLLPGAAAETHARCASSVIGQCVLFDFARKALNRMAPDLELTTANIDAFTDFIVDFSLGGMARLGMDPAGQGQARLTFQP